mmetsp:Transcript_17123/g.28610  ORF Transcript_17123/g.28610 Transcript_17123/m.28610 type:complete len:209 (-) Transcript_17123:157-783(-)
MFGSVKLIAVASVLMPLAAAANSLKLPWEVTEKVEGGCTCSNPYCCPDGWPCEDHNPSVCCPPDTPVICGSTNSCCQSGFECCGNTCCSASQGYKCCGDSCCPLETVGNNTTKAEGKSVVTTYYADSQCKTIGGGPPGLINNPFAMDVGDCEVLMSNGYSVKATACTTNGMAESIVYPVGCNGPHGESFSVQEGVCVETQGVYSISKC